MNTALMLCDAAPAAPAPQAGGMGMLVPMLLILAIFYFMMVRPQQRKEKAQGYRHKCEVCGRTDADYPDLQFRYCSRCAGYHCYCEDHIFNHTHITE